MALVDQARLAEARKQLEEALGPLASFEVITARTAAETDRGPHSDDDAPRREVTPATRGVARELFGHVGRHREHPGSPP